MINKESIIEILKMYSSDVDNFNKAVFEDEFNTVAGLIQQLLNKHDVMRWRDFKEQKPKTGENVLIMNFKSGQSIIVEWYSRYEYMMKEDDKWIPAPAIV